MSDDPKGAWVRRVLRRDVGARGAVGGHRGAAPGWTSALPGGELAAAGLAIGAQRGGAGAAGDGAVAMEQAASAAYTTMQASDAGYSTMALNPEVAAAGPVRAVDPAYAMMGEPHPERVAAPAADGPGVGASLYSNNGEWNLEAPAPAPAAAPAPESAAAGSVDPAYVMVDLPAEPAALPAADGPGVGASLYSNSGELNQEAPEPEAVALSYTTDLGLGAARAAANRGPAAGSLSPGAAAWASGIDFSTLKKGKRIKSGAFGEVSWLKAGDSAGGAPGADVPLVFKLPKEPESHAELEHEAAFYAKAGDHPNLPKCLGMCVIGGKSGLVMEGIKGRDMAGTLDEMRKQYDKGTLSHEKFFGSLQYMLTQMVDTIEYLGQQGIVHADIRPDNIMIDGATGGVKVVDFGVAVETGAVPAKNPIFAGSVSPDVPAGVDSQHDMFGAGATAYVAGEGEQFRYHEAPGAALDANSVMDFKLPADGGGAARQALRGADAGNPAFTMAPAAGGVAKKAPGRFGAETEYTRFINAMMHPDKDKRLTPEQARRHKFLADPLLDEAAARAVLQGILNPAPKAAAPPEPARGSGEVGAPIIPAEYSSTLWDARESAEPVV